VRAEAADFADFGLQGVNQPTQRRRTTMTDATYTATRSHATPTEVTLHAKGTNPTTGYHPHFGIKNILVHPPNNLPTFEFLNPAPTGAIGNIVLPFNVTATYGFPENLESVAIFDSHGEHAVKITKTH